MSGPGPAKSIMKRGFNSPRLMAHIYFWTSAAGMIWLAREFFFKRTLEEHVALRKAEDKKIADTVAKLWGGQMKQPIATTSNFTPARARPESADNSKH